MSEPTQSDVTLLLQRWGNGDSAALNSVIPVVYRELRAIAQNYLSRERPGHTLQSTALVHEVYERMVQQALPEWRNRAHFFAVAAQLMRQILVDHARSRSAGKRGGALTRIPEEALGEVAVPVDLDIVALDEALTELTKLDSQQGRIVEMKIFVGLTNEEMAEVLGVSKSTVKRDWEIARVWLYRELTDVKSR